MKLPNRNRNWLKEIKAAYAKAERDVIRDGKDLNDLYIYAVKYVAKNRGINNKDTIREIIQHSFDAIKIDIKNDPESANHHVFHFVSTYIYSHCFADLKDELECDKIMDYVNNEWDLFEN
ncbi:hypothetical protein NBRC116494_12690 [Aurantivibrio plasticivorans]